MAAGGKGVGGLLGAGGRLEIGEHGAWRRVVGR